MPISSESKSSAAELDAGGSLPPIFMPINSRPKAIELCAGTASLAAQLRLYGFDVCAVDTKRNRFKVKFPITDLDLCAQDSIDVLMEAISKSGVQYIHAGIPCGTASRAREIPMEGNKNAPRPLRTEKEPWGRTDIELTEVEKAKLKAANIVYENVAALLLAATQLGIIVSIENPERSLVWSLECFQRLLHSGLEDITFQQCALGGNRPKRTTWRGTKGVFGNLRQLCPGESASHKHLPWGMVRSANGRLGFATAEEAAYPTKLCITVAECVRTELLQRGFALPPPNLNPDFDHASLQQKARAQGAGRSTMGKRPLPLVAEFHSVQYMKRADVNPKRQRIIRDIIRGEQPSDAPDCEVVVGDLWEPEEFIGKALCAKHPIDVTDGVPAAVRDNIEWIIQQGPVQVARHRLHTIREVLKLIHDCKAEESILHNSWPDYRKGILQDKQMVALGKLASSISHPDVHVVGEACEGFRLVGVQPHSGYFQQQTVLAIATPEAISTSALVNNTKLLNSTKSSGDRQLDMEAWNLVQEEISKGWLTEPVYSLKEATNKWPGLVISRRFPLRQGPKIRLIDDFNESNVNLAYTHSEKLSFHDIDVISATVGTISQRLRTSKPHVDWNNQSLRFLGRTLDLKSAYKQWVVSDDCLKFNIICIWDPVSNRPAILGQYTLPFGAVAAVVNFNRIARLLWELLTRKLRLVILNFYDDFPAIEPAATAGLALKASETFLRLLGWQFAENGPKSPPFAEVFTALGVIFDLSRLDMELATVYHKQSRIDAIKDDIVRICERKTMTKLDKESLRGRLQFLERQVFGRLGKFLINRLCGPCLGPSGAAGWSVERYRAAQDTLEWLSSLSPRIISPSGSSMPCLIFTDGAEGDVPGAYAACGALFIDPETGLREFFGEPIPDTLVDEWRSVGITKIIAQAELLPIWLALREWAPRIRNRRVLIFVDNESAKFSCINMWSPNLATNNLLRLIASWNLTNQSWLWFSRVPSYSNPADPASRLVPQEVIRRFGATQIRCKIPGSIQLENIPG